MYLMTPTDEYRIEGVLVHCSHDSSSPSSRLGLAKSPRSSSSLPRIRHSAGCESACVVAHSGEHIGSEHGPENEIGMD